MSDTQVLTTGTTQTIAVASASAATSAAFSENSRVVRVVCTVDCHLEFADSPTAATTDLLLPADHVEYFKIPSNGTTKLAAIRGGSTDGTLRVTEFE